VKKFLTIGAALGLTLGLAACGPYTLDSGEVNNARLSAYEAAPKYGLEVADVLNQDSDKDGYVTATFRKKAAPHDGVEMLCPYKAVGACKFKPAK
jgi:hypothetical protein